MEHLLTDHILLSRIQFALTTMFHIIWPALTIGLSIFIFAAELAWVKTGNVEWRRQARFWTKFFLLAFAMGVISGVPLEFQFGTNWSRFSVASGNFLGQILSVETMSGFMLESIFLYFMVAGWKRLSPGMHLFSTGMVALGASISAFWIMVANSWMQTPSGGGRMVDGVYQVTDRLAAIFNPDIFASFPHMWLACLTSTAFIICGVSAWHILRHRHSEFYLRAFKAGVAAALFFSLLQAFTGDLSGRTVARYQPAKLAATEAFWETNKPGEGAAWSIFAWPDTEAERNYVELRIPFVLSILATHDPFGRVTGLKDIPEDERPPITLIFYSFRIMVFTGTLMIIVALWAVWTWYKGRLTPIHAARQRKLMKFFIWLAPFSIIAIWTGWIMREVGRQPWIIYGLLRTDDASSPLTAGAVSISLGYFALAAVFFITLFCVFSVRILRKGPETDQAPDEPESGRPT
ncbi:cytochrome ubiquinol oxidase subunit I [Oceanidesulfovibrio marinus]|uniref:Cytochrome ubiquinol oxidase subunit I n=1 Tax=Oceanidesulfovibrio marinus TaxID=370038 RepID=A0ABX6NFY9_9BACT|nr:cytochrome ubiquinol oxidase subunit I [Oceanidesulfovibrio marinus]QJT09543.1 cytochrome ubiquinol oxidase subunit I [Oceanidesulfovibrio marinus]